MRKGESSFEIDRSYPITGEPSPNTILLNFYLS